MTIEQTVDQTPNHVMQPVTISEEDIDLPMLAPGSVPPPPARVAARIYKTRTYHQQQHRKSSAASSRRNSVTSHISNRSGRSTHSTPQSTHVAQHLRRASIIETRRAKAADWNAHAEKVRIRAALNKAAPRISVADSEERALAAQQARERLLAQVKATCAAEVQRSKKVAEEQREKRAAAYAKMKEDMEERQLQAQKRRALLEQSGRKSKPALQNLVDSDAEASVPSTRRRTYVWKPRNEIEAAQIIQAAWRRKFSQLVIQQFLELGLTVESVRDAEFEDVGRRLNEERVIQRTSRLLRLFKLGVDSHGSISKETLSVRTFLTCFLILGHPAQVLNKNGDQEQGLISKANDLLLAVNRRIIHFTNRHNLQADADLTLAHTSYEAAFMTWRSYDSTFMITNMVAQFVELDAIWQAVKNDTIDEVAEDYKAGIRQNQTLILVKLKRLAGPERATKLIKEAVRKSRRTRVLQTKKLDDRPRAVLHDGPLTSTDSLPASLGTIAQSQGRSRDGEITVGEPAGSGLTDEARNTLRRSSRIPESRQIMHEIAINGEWKIDISQQEGRQDEFVRAFSTQLQAGLNSGLADLWIPAISESIRDKLCSILPDGKPTSNLIREVLEPGLIQQQVRQDAFSYRNFFDFMRSLLPTLCAPVRDSEVKRIVDEITVDPIEQIARITYLVDLIVLDVLNFQLTSLAPKLLAEAPTYEARAFERLMHAKPVPVDTLTWWNESRLRCEAAETLTTIPPSKSCSTRIYMSGLVDLALTSITAPTSTGTIFPETLLLDRARLTSYRHDTLRLVCVAAMLLNAKSLLRRDSRSLWKTEASRMWDLLCPPSSMSPSTFTPLQGVISSAPFIAIVEQRYALPPATKSQMQTFFARILNEYQASLSPSSSTPAQAHPVLKVLVKKLRSFILRRLLAASAEERARLSASATETLATASMIEFVSRVEGLVVGLAAVARVDWDAHGVWYERIIEAVGKATE